MRYGMVIDLKRCIGCDACTMGCKEANGTPAGVFWSRVLHTERGEYPKAYMEYTPLLCMHCANPPCVRNCPTGASRQEEDGIVHVIAADCIGCKQCIVSCPYQARTYQARNPEGYFPAYGNTPKEKLDYVEFQRGKVTKCDFCRERLQQDEPPMCVRTCPADARIFGDLDDPNSKVAVLLRKREGKQLAVEMGTNPSVYYVK